MWDGARLLMSDMSKEFNPEMMARPGGEHSYDLMYLDLNSL